MDLLTLSKSSSETVSAWQMIWTRGSMEEGSLANRMRAWTCGSIVMPTSASRPKWLENLSIAREGSTCSKILTSIAALNSRYIALRPGFPYRCSSLSQTESANVSVRYLYWMEKWRRSQMLPRAFELFSSQASISSSFPYTSGTPSDAGAGATGEGLTFLILNHCPWLIR